MSATTEARIVEVVTDTPLHVAQLELRGAVLRIPLGLDPATARNPREAEAQHFVALDPHDAVMGCVSLLPLGNGVGKLFQMAVAERYQRQGLGQRLVRALEAAAGEAGFRRIQMHARDIAVPFYEKLGYACEGDLFYEVSIPHYTMAKELS